MKTKIYIIRHTQTTGNVEKRLAGRTDYEITEEGQVYINKLTNRLKDVKFNKIYSSTSKRAIKTVEKLAVLNNLEIETSDDLCEMYFGIYDGYKWEEVNKINPKIDEDHIKTNEIMGIPNQETTADVQKRMYNYISKIAKENINKTILIASHGVAIESFLRKVTNEPFLVKKEEYSQKNTTVNIVEYDAEDDKFDLKLLNDCSHLEEKCR